MNAQSEATVSITFSYEELALLLGLLKLPPLPGFPVDFLNEFRTETGRSRLDVAEHGLQARQFIQVTPDRTITVDPLVVSLLANFRASETLITVLNINNGVTTQSLFGLSQYMISEYTIAEPGMHRLTWFPDLKTLNGVLLVQNDLSTLDTPKQAIYIAVPPEWAQAYQAALRQSTQGLAEYLTTHTGADPNAEALNAVFSSLREVYAVIGLRRDAETLKTLQNFAILRTATDNWLLISDPQGTPDNLWLVQAGSVQIAEALVTLEQALGL